MADHPRHVERNADAASAADELSLVELGPLTASAEAELEAGESNPFDSDGTLEWRDKERWLALVEGDGRLAAAAGLVSAHVAVDGAPRIEVAGIGGVIVRADRRGEGLARRVVQAALARGATPGPAFALLFCRPDRAGLYVRLGFERIDAPVAVDQPGGPVTMHMETMWRALRPGARWPAGPVVLDGLPF